MSSSTQSGLIVARLTELTKFLKRQQKSEHTQVAILLVTCGGTSSVGDCWPEQPACDSFASQPINRTFGHRTATHFSCTGWLFTAAAGNSVLGQASLVFRPCVCSCVSHAGAVTLSNLQEWPKRR